MSYLEEAIAFGTDPAGYVVDKATNFYEENEEVIDGAANGAIAGAVEGYHEGGIIGSALWTVTGAPAS